MWSVVAARIVGMLVRPTTRMMHTLFILCLIIWPLLHGLTGGFDAWSIGGWCVFGAWLILRAAAFRELRKLPQRYADAFERGDADALAEVSRLFAYVYADSVMADAMLHSLAGVELIVRKKWIEARDELAKVKRRVLPKESDVVALNNFAYATARAGDATKAVTLAESAVEQARHIDTPTMKRYIASLRGTHAIALHLADRNDEALPILEEVAREEALPRLVNERSYWLGRVYRALGRQDDAHAAFSRAAAVEGPCRDEARSELASSTPFRG
jgi:hypothetical protein